MSTYIEFPLKNTAIAVEAAEYESHTVIPEHTHRFQEFVLITKGACMHTFRGIEIPLIAGDVFLVPPHQTHSYIMNSQIRFINCYFYPEQLGEDWKKLMQDVLPSHSSSDRLDDIKSQWENLLSNISSFEKDIPAPEEPIDKSHIQGIIHLNPQEALRVESLLMQILEEQTEEQFGTEYIKASLLQVILVTIKRAQNRQPQKLLKQNTRKKELINKRPGIHGRTLHRGTECGCDRQIIRPVRKLFPHAVQGCHRPHSFGVCNPYPGHQIPGIHSA